MAIPSARIARFCLFACLSLGVGQLAVAGQAKYGATVKTVKPAALASAKTYAWAPGHGAFDKTVDAQIVAAVDRELRARGLTKVDSGPSDVVVAYGSLTRTDVDLKSKTKTANGLPPEYAVGALVVDLKKATTQELLFRVQSVAPIEKSPAELEAAIDKAVTAIFEKYPAPSKR